MYLILHLANKCDPIGWLNEWQNVILTFFVSFLCLWVIRFLNARLERNPFTYAENDCARMMTFKGHHTFILTREVIRCRAVN